MKCVTCVSFGIYVMCVLCGCIVMWSMCGGYVCSWMGCSVRAWYVWCVCGVPNVRYCCGVCMLRHVHPCGRDMEYMTNVEYG